MKILQFAILLACLASLSTELSAQVLDVPEGKEKEIARQAIQDLKEGVLFVRLKNYDDMIATLMKSGSKGRAEKVRARTEKFNNELMNAFKKNFDFCPVYFFDVPDTEKVLNRDFEGMKHNDEPLQLSDDQKMFVAIWGFNRGKGEPAASTTIEGILLHSAEDDKIVRLPKPFPYFTRYPEPLFNFSKRKRYEYHTGRLNERLHAFYKS